jgi:hypothetical protein
LIDWLIVIFFFFLTPLKIKSIFEREKYINQSSVYEINYQLPPYVIYMTCNKF